MKRIAAVAALLALSGCMTAQERVAKDDEHCLSYGVPKGSPAYVQCRAQRDQNRSNVAASERFGQGTGLASAIRRAQEE